MEEQDVSSGADIDALSFMQDHQKRLYRALTELDRNLARIYVGALQVLADESNLDRFALAAHGLREIMRQAPKSIDVPIRQEEQNRYDLGDAVRDMDKRWQEMVKHTDCSEEGKSWVGEIDDRLRYYLARLNDFFNTFRTNRPKTRESVHSLLNALELTDTPVAARAVDTTFEQWKEFRRFFNRLAHHDPFPGEEVFEEQLISFEEFLLDLLIPPTSEAFSDVEQIISEAEDRHD